MDTYEHKKQAIYIAHNATIHPETRNGLVMMLRRLVAKKEFGIEVPEAIGACDEYTMRRLMERPTK